MVNYTICHRMDDLHVWQLWSESTFYLLAEHYLIDHNLLMNEPNNYYLNSRFSYQSYSGGSVCMYVKSNLESTITYLPQYCIEKVTEVCAVQIKTDKHLIIMHIQIS
jgi:hypothetical protein